MVGRRVLFCELGSVAAARVAPPGAPRARAPGPLRRSSPASVAVSVCIVNWNGRELLRACLNSLAGSSQGVPLEAIVVDNDSRDGAADMVEREFPEVVLVRNAGNAGFARANNQAAALARGRYLFFLNNDTAVPPGTLQRLIEFAEAHPDVGIVAPRLRGGDGSVQISGRSLPTAATFISGLSLVRATGLMRSSYRRYRRSPGDPGQTRPVELVLGAALLIPRTVFDQCGGWDEEFVFGGEDLDLCRRVGRRYRILYHGAVQITHHGRASTRLHAAYASRTIPVGFVRYLRKSGSHPAAVLAYKVALSVDAPAQLVGKWLQGALRLARGRRSQAAKSFGHARATWHFLSRGLLPFWRA